MNRGVKFTWSKESCRARLKNKIENFIVYSIHIYILYNFIVYF